jgi:hypothetical protein
MWTPTIAKEKKKRYIDEPYGSSSSSDVSSSSSSDSSEVSSDDEKTINDIRNNCFTPPEIQELLYADKKFKFILIIRHINRLIQKRIDVIK